jgi:hypothetical protein
MKLTAEDYRESYRTLSDEEFLAIDRDDLVDVARRCYDAELKRRQLEPRTEEDDTAEFEAALESTAMPDDEEIVQVALLTDLGRATYARKILLDADIPANLNGKPALPGIYAEGAIGLLVPASCAELARELLAQNLTGDNQLLVRRWLEHEWTPDGLELTDFHVIIDDVFGDADKVAARLTVQGVDPHTRKDVKLGGLAIVHVADGHIREHWVKLDS